MTILQGGSGILHYEQSRPLDPPKAEPFGPLVWHDGKGNTYGIVTKSGHPIAPGAAQVVRPPDAGRSPLPGIPGLVHTLAKSGRGLQSVHLGTGARIPLSQPTQTYATSPQAITGYATAFQQVVAADQALKGTVQLNRVGATLNEDHTIRTPAVISIWLPPPQSNTDTVAKLLQGSGAKLLDEAEMQRRGIPLVGPSPELLQQGPRILPGLTVQRSEILLASLPAAAVPQILPNSTPGAHGFVVLDNARQPWMVMDRVTNQPHLEPDSTFRGGNHPRLFSLYEPNTGRFDDMPPNATVYPVNPEQQQSYMDLSSVHRELREGRAAVVSRPGDAPDSVRLAVDKHRMPNITDALQQAGIAPGKTAPIPGD
jgi:hypothetical protein